MQLRDGSPNMNTSLFPIRSRSMKSRRQARRTIRRIMRDLRANVHGYLAGDDLQTFRQMNRAILRGPRLA
jgi:hypothetical protein